MDSVVNDAITPPADSSSIFHSENERTATNQLNMFDSLAISKPHAILTFERMCEQLAQRFRDAVDRSKQRSHCRAQRYLTSYCTYEFNQRPHQLQLLSDMAVEINRDFPQWSSLVDNEVETLINDWNAVRETLTPRDCWTDGGVRVMEDVSSDIVDLRLQLEALFRDIPPTSAITQALLSKERRQFDDVWQQLNSALLSLKNKALITLQLYRLLEQVEADILTSHSHFNNSSSSSSHQTAPLSTEESVKFRDRINQFRTAVLHLQRLCHQLNIRCLEAVCLIEQGKLIPISNFRMSTKKLSESLDCSQLPNSSDSSILSTHGSGFSSTSIPLDNNSLKIVVSSSLGLESGLGSDSSVHMSGPGCRLNQPTIHHSHETGHTSIVMNELTPASSVDIKTITSSIIRHSQASLNKLMSSESLSRYERTLLNVKSINKSSRGLYSRLNFTASMTTHSCMRPKKSYCGVSIMSRYEPLSIHPSHQIIDMLDVSSSDSGNHLQPGAPITFSHHSRDLMVVLSENDIFHLGTLRFRNHPTSCLDNDLTGSDDKRKSNKNCSSGASNVHVYSYPRSRSRSLELPRVWTFDETDGKVEMEQEEPPTPISLIMSTNNESYHSSTSRHKTDKRLSRVNATAYYQLACIGDVDEEEVSDTYERGDSFVDSEMNKSRQNVNSEASQELFRPPTVFSKISGSSVQSFWSRSGEAAMNSGVYHARKSNLSQRFPYNLQSSRGSCAESNTAQSTTSARNWDLPIYRSGSMSNNEKSLDLSISDHHGTCYDMSVDSLMEDIKSTPRLCMNTTDDASALQDESDGYVGSDIRRYLALAEEADRWISRIGPCSHLGVPSIDQACQTDFSASIEATPMSQPCPPRFYNPNNSGVWEGVLEDYWDPIQANYYSQEEGADDSMEGPSHMLQDSGARNSSLGLFEDDFSVPSSDSGVAPLVTTLEKSCSESNLDHRPQDGSQCYESGLYTNSDSMASHLPPHYRGRDFHLSNTHVIEPNFKHSSSEGGLATHHLDDTFLSSGSSLAASLAASECLPSSTLPRNFDLIQELRENGPVSLSEVQQHLVDCYHSLVESATSLPLPLIIDCNYETTRSTTQMSVERIMNHVNQVIARAQGNMNCLQGLLNGSIAIAECEDFLTSANEAGMQVPCSKTQQSLHNLKHDVASLLFKWSSLNKHCQHIIQYLSHLQRVSEEADKVQELISHTVKQSENECGDVSNTDVGWYEILRQRDTILKDCERQLCQYKSNLNILQGELHSVVNSSSKSHCDNPFTGNHQSVPHSSSSLELPSPAQENLSNLPQTLSESEFHTLSMNNGPGQESLMRWCASESSRLIALQRWTDSLLCRNHTLQCMLRMVIRAFCQVDRLYDQCERSLSHLDNLLKRMNNGCQVLDETLAGETTRRIKIKAELRQLNDISEELQRCDSFLREASTVWDILASQNISQYHISSSDNETNPMSMTSSPSLPRSNPCTPLIRHPQPDLLCGNGGRHNPLSNPFPFMPISTITGLEDGTSLKRQVLPGQRHLVKRNKTLHEWLDKLMDNAQETRRRLETALPKSELSTPSRCDRDTQTSFMYPLSMEDKLSSHARMNPFCLRGPCLFTCCGVFLISLILYYSLFYYMDDIALWHLIDPLLLQYINPKGAPF